MAKRIVVCSDGTGNTAIKGRGTNVFKLFEAVDLNGHRIKADLTPQVALYDDGVGTQNFLPLRLLGGAFGWGLGRNVKQLYRSLVRIYDPGDEIYMVGFSRGAFTVRTLVGFIARCGLVDRDKLKVGTVSELKSIVNQAYRTYRKSYRTWLSQLVRGKPKADIGEVFKREHSLSGEVKIRFLGCWDTVDAVGLPFHLADFLNATFYRFKFPDHKLSKTVDRACQALAVDEPRQAFEPVLWDEAGRDPRIEQVWFSGAHSNVGGGYPKQGMSLVALDWMLSQAERAGLSFDEPGLRINSDERLSYSEHANVDDKLYDPRRGVGMFYRWKIRDIESMCRDHAVKPKLHVSVLERIAHGTEDYAPGNLPRGAQVVTTEPRDPKSAAMVSHRAANVQDALSNAQERLFDAVKDAIVVGTLSYYVYLLSCVGVAAIVIIGTASARTGGGMWSLIKAVGRLIGGLVTSPMQTGIEITRQLLSTPQMLSYLLGAFAISFVMDLYADRRMSAVFSKFWYQQQQNLRNALKKARKEMGAAV